MCKLPQLALALALLAASVLAPAAQWRKASDWLGMPVVTDQGEQIGEVEDFALDLESGQLNYVVVSVGSFLIKDALIAVSPGALLLQGSQLVIASDGLAKAQRFGADAWPAEADVVASEPSVQEEATGPSGPEAPAAVGSTASGVATISSDRRTLTLSGGERRIEDVSAGSADPSLDLGATPKVTIPPISRAPDSPLPSFGNLDQNRNGVLTRREIGAWLRPDESYGEIDLDSSGTVDRFEFDIFSAQRKR